MGDNKAQCREHLSIVIFNWVCSKVCKVYILVMMMIMVIVVMLVTMMMMH